MDLGSRLEALLTLAEELEIEIRAEPRGGDGGGLCRLRGRQVLFVDTSADLATRYDRTLGAMAGLSEIEERYVVPEVRQDLDQTRSAGTGGRPRPV
jgi:hypothetical protein